MLIKDKILSLGASGKLFFGSSRKTRIISGVGLFLAVCAFGAAGVAPMAPDPADLPVKSITRELAIPNLNEQIARLQSEPQSYIREEMVRSGDTLASLLDRLGVDDAEATAFIKSDATAQDLLKLRPGHHVLAQTGQDGELQRLVATLTDGAPVKDLLISRDGEHFHATEAVGKLDRRIEMHTGEIKSSLFAATDAAGIPDGIAMQMVDMFATNINFASDLRRGDHFNVIYETFWQNGNFVSSGRVLAGEFINAGHKYQSVWFDNPDSKQGGGYYTFDGKSLKKAFLKSPLKFTRISSGFSMRLHPILGIWKKHEGVDFAAPAGTPIHAAGDGTVEFVGVQRGYGNVVILKHWDNYSTVYGHMSRFAGGLHRGMKVSQGDVIGYVGMTGWATGPHLHYEFRVANQPRDPMSIDIPNTQALAGADLQRFRAVASDMKHRIALLDPQPADSTKVAAK